MVADALLRVDTNALFLGKPPTPNFAAMAEAEATDTLIRSLQSSSTTTQIVGAISLANSSNSLYCYTSNEMKLPVVPLLWRRILFDFIAEVRQWTRDCLQCQHAKIQRHSVSTIASFPTPDSRFDIVHVDLVGPLRLSQIFTSHVLVSTNGERTGLV